MHCRWGHFSLSGGSGGFLFNCLNDFFDNFEERNDDHRRIVVVMFIFIHPTPDPLPASGEGRRCSQPLAMWRN